MNNIQKNRSLLKFNFFSFFFLEQDARKQRISDVHTLVHRLPQTNQEMLEIVIRHLKA